MFVLVIIACMTFGDRTSCQEFPRDHAFINIQSCERAAVIEEGRYARRGAPPLFFALVAFQKRR
ncbi:MAG: hypothetical protein OSB69_10195 [Alphaproteobacteria bacterium]|nr:hypothetical protein [Alphaproteobacteria bacterium]